MKQEDSRESKENALFPVWPILLLAMGALTVLRQPVADAVTDGVQQCIILLLPTLFPYFILTNLLLETDFPQVLCRLLGRWMTRVFHTTPTGALALSVSLLGGYPLGAKTVAQLHVNGKISKVEANQLLAFCNNTGPAIFFGLIGGALHWHTSLLFLLYMIHVLSALCTGWLLRPKLPLQYSAQVWGSKESRTLSVTDAILSAFFSVTRICAFVLAFRVLLAAGKYGLEMLWPAAVKQPVLCAVLTGILDLPNGIQQLCQISSTPLQLLLCCAFVNWGGVCVHLQTKAVVISSRLCLSQHLRGKILQSGIATMLCLPVACILAGAKISALLIGVAFLLFAVLLQKYKSKVEISPQKRYNTAKVG